MDDHSAGAVRVQLGGGCVLISVVGEFDRRLHEVFVQAVGSGGGDVAVDLSETTFLDSSGLRSLVIGWRDTESRGGRLRIDRASDLARRSIEVCGLAEHLGLGPTPDSDPSVPDLESSPRISA